MLGTNNAEFRAAFERHYAINKPAAEIAAEWKASNAVLRLKEKAEKAEKKAKKAEKEAVKTAEKAARKSLKAAAKIAKTTNAAEAIPAAPVIPSAQEQPQAAPQPAVREIDINDLPEVVQAAMGALGLDSALTVTEACNEFCRFAVASQGRGVIEPDLVVPLIAKFYDEVGKVKALVAKKDWNALAHELEVPVAQAMISAAMMDTSVSVEEAIAKIRCVAEEEMALGRFGAEEMATRMAVVEAKMGAVKDAVKARDFEALVALLANRPQQAPVAASSNDTKQSGEAELPSNVTVEITDSTVHYTVDLGAAAIEPVPDTAMAAAMQRANAPKGNARKGNAPKGKQ